jgi:hypothetical protein
MKTLIARAALCILLVSGGAFAEPLPLPGKVVDFRSADGQRILEESRFWSTGYGRISAVFETQKTQSYCGVASMVMALNALGAPAPVTPPYGPYAVFTQDNILDARTDAIRPRDMILMRGMLASGDAVVVVNFLRGALDEGRGGHFSPLGAYDEKEDRFLMLDVARYKYPPAWVKAADLFAAMNTPDPDNEGKTRGYAIISRRATAATAPAQ